MNKYHALSSSAQNGGHLQQTAQFGKESSNWLYTVADIAERLGLKAQPNGKFSGAPEGTGKTKDGFILCPEGNAFTNDGTKYTSRQVAEIAGINPDQYEPVAQHKARNGTANVPTSSPRAVAFKSKQAAFNWKAATLFDYHDESGALLYQVGRIGEGSAKQIRQRRPDGRGGWVYSLEGARRVLWRLPDVLNADFVVICEGEKAATALNAAFEKSGHLGAYLATTNPQGAGKWKSEFNASLAGKTVCVLPDFDEAGEKHAQEVLASLFASPENEQPSSLCRVDLPDLSPKGDVFDWLEGGGTGAELIDLAKAVPEWEPAKELEEKQTPSKLIRIGDLHARPAPKWLIQRFLVQNATSLFTADSGSYKSFIGLHIAYCVAHGIPFFGRGVAQSGPVVYVAGEGGDGLRARSMAWDKHHERESPENLFVWESAVQLANAEEVKAFLLELKEAGVFPSLIIFDTLNRCAEGLEENSARDMGLFVAGLERIKRATKAHVCVIHHNNANGKSRGSTALPGAFDTRFSAEREGQTVILRCQKQKDGASEFEPFAVAARSVEIGEVDEFGDPITSLVLEPSDKVLTSENRTNKTGAKERTSAAILAELAKLRASATDDTKVSKTDWEEAVTKAGICSRSVFYTHTKELENAGRWFWWKGDCRLEEAIKSDEKSDFENRTFRTCEESDALSEKTPENALFERKSPESPESPESPISDVLDATETKKSEKSDKSGFSLENRTNRTNRTYPAQDDKDSDTKPIKRVATDFKPYTPPLPAVTTSALEEMEGERF